MYRAFAIIVSTVAVLFVVGAAPASAISCEPVTGGPALPPGYLFFGSLGCVPQL